MNELIGPVAVLLLILGGLYVMTRGLPLVVLAVLGIAILAGAFPQDPMLAKLCNLVMRLMPLLLILGFLSLLFRRDDRRRR